MESSGGPITKDNTSVEYYGTIFAACESLTEKDVIWAGSDDGLVHVTMDGGKNWEDVTPPSSIGADGGSGMFEAGSVNSVTVPRGEVSLTFIRPGCAPAPPGSQTSMMDSVRSSGCRTQSISMASVARRSSSACSRSRCMFPAGNTIRALRPTKPPG